MSGRVAWQLCLAGSVLAISSLAHAQCTKDTDCKGDRVCEAGVCTSPQALPPAPPPPGAAPAPAPASSSSSEPAPAPSAPPQSPAPIVIAPPAMPLLPDEAPPPERRSKAALVSGIVMVSVGPVALLGALVAKNAQDRCDSDLKRDYSSQVLPSSERYREDDCNAYSLPLYVLSIGGALLTAAGIPLIIYGGKTLPRQQAAHVQLVPWATPSSGGFRLRLEL